MVALYGPREITRPPSLEELNYLQRTILSLFCAYPMNAFAVTHSLSPSLVFVPRFRVLPPIARRLVPRDACQISSSAKAKTLQQDQLEKKRRKN